MFLSDNSPRGEADITPSTSLHSRPRNRSVPPPPPWTSSGSHSQVWLIGIPFADIGWDSPQLRFTPAIFQIMPCLPTTHSHLQCCCWEGIRDNPQQVKRTMGGEIFLTEQKCSLQCAQHVGYPPPTSHDEMCTPLPSQLVFFFKVALMTLWGTWVTTLTCFYL